MNKFLKGCVILIFSLIGIFALILLSGNIQVRLRQEKLAKILQVKIEDYPFPQSFPSGYFYSILKPGMTREEVHRIMKGYEKAYDCSNTEMYYFYSQDEDAAERLFIFYSLNGLFEKIQGEDKNSRYWLRSSDCSEGLLTQ